MDEINKTKQVGNGKKDSILETVQSDVRKGTRKRERGSFWERCGGSCNICVEKHIHVERLGWQEEA